MKVVTELSEASFARLVRLLLVVLLPAVVVIESEEGLFASDDERLTGVDDCNDSRCTRGRAVTGSVSS